MHCRNVTLQPGSGLTSASKLFRRQCLRLFTPHCGCRLIGPCRIPDVLCQLAVERLPSRRGPLCGSARGLRGAGWSDPGNAGSQGSAGRQARPGCGPVVGGHRGAIGLPRETVFRQFGGGGPATVKPSQSASRRFRVYIHGAAELVEDERRREAFLLQAQVGTVLGGQCG